LLQYLVMSMIIEVLGLVVTFVFKSVSTL